MTRLLFDNGRIALPERVAKALPASGLTLASWSQRHLLLAGGGDVLFAGKLGELGVADLLSFIQLFRKSGILHFALPGGVRELVIVDGELVDATSTFPEEELGEILLGQKKLDRYALLKVRHKAGASETELQRLLLAEGVSAEDLWSARLDRCESIVYHLIPCQQGDYALLRAPAPQPDAPRFALNLQSLVMEGLRRCDERQLFLRNLGSGDALLTPAGPAPGGLSPQEERLLALLGQAALTAREAVGRSGLAELDALRLLDGLRQRGILRIAEEPARRGSAELIGLIAVCNGALAELHRRISSRNHAYGLEVRRYLRDLPHPYDHVFRHVPLAEDGTLSPERLAANLAGLEEEAQRKLLVEAMNELLLMACLAARRDLGEADSVTLVQRVQEIGRRTRNLLERNPG